MINTIKGGYALHEKDDYELIILGDINLFKENGIYKSYVKYQDERFFYHGIENVLCGKTGYLSYEKFKGETFTPKHILVIQME